MELGIANKRIMITGASRGIGYAIAESFLREGARVIMLARNLNNLELSAEVLQNKYGGERVLKYSIDCSDLSAWSSILKDIEFLWDGLDVVVANVGDGRGPRVALPDSDRFSLAWNTNFSSAIETARATLPLIERNKGCYLFISSIAGLEAIGAPTDYSVAKSALIALTKQMARRLAPSVRVNCIAPGNVFSVGGSWDEKIKEEPERIKSLIQSTVPMNRFGTPEEIADAATFLCSERANFITGATLVVDGGQSVQIF